MKDALSTLTIDAIQTACGYGKIDPIRQVYYSEFNVGKDDFPGRYDKLPVEVATRLLKRMSRPYAGRPATAIQAALSMLEILQAGNGLEKPQEAPAEKQAPTANSEPEQAAAAVTQSENPVPLFSSRWFYSQAVYIWTMPLLEKAYYIGVFIAMGGLWHYMDVIGAGVAAVYFLVSRKAMLMAKDKTVRESAKLGLFAVVVMEFAAWFIHFAMYNILLWERAGELPWHIVERVKVNGAMIETNATPGTVAVCIASFMSGICAYAVWQMLSITSEKADNDYWAERGI